MPLAVIKCSLFCYQNGTFLLHFFLKTKTISRSVMSRNIINNINLWIFWSAKLQRKQNKRTFYKIYMVNVKLCDMSNWSLLMIVNDWKVVNIQVAVCLWICFTFLFFKCLNFVIIRAMFATRHTNLEFYVHVLHVLKQHACLVLTKLRWKLKCVYLIACCPLFTCLLSSVCKSRDT